MFVINRYKLLIFNASGKTKLNASTPVLNDFVNTKCI